MRDSLLNTITISQAEVTQLQLVKRFFKDNGFRAQAAKSDVIYIARNGQGIIGALRLCLYDKSWLLRSMCIKEEFRHKGIGLMFLKSIHNELQSKRCYCFPYLHLENFYQQAGFTHIEPQQSAAVIANKYNNYLSKGKQILIMRFTG
jgi:N-acetylglutamate synthase-like GNAT family acetyltransferase